MQSRIADAIDNDEVTRAEVDRGSATILDHRRLKLRETRKAERGEIDLVGAGKEIADHVAAGAMLEHEGVSARFAEQHVVAALAVEHIISGAAEQVIA